MTQLVGALVSVHNALALLTNLDSLPDPPCSSVRLMGDDCCLIPVDNVIFCVDVVCDSRFFSAPTVTVSLCFRCIYALPIALLLSHVLSCKLQNSVLFLQCRPFGNFYTGHTVDQAGCQDS